MKMGGELSKKKKKERKKQVATDKIAYVPYKIIYLKRKEKSMNEINLVNVTEFPPVWERAAYSAYHLLFRCLLRYFIVCFTFVIEHLLSQRLFLNPKLKQRTIHFNSAREVTS